MTGGINPVDGVSRRTILKTSAIAVGALGMSASATANNGVTTQTGDILGQEDAVTGDRDVYAEDAATIRRTPDSISMEVSMPTPEPGTYRYPEGTEEGHPEGFTLWAFTFNNPDACVDGCGGDEPWGGDAGKGAFGVAGHLVGGPHLQLSGTVSTKTDPFIGSPLENPMGAEVHLAVAPHGALDPEDMPDAIKTPAGSPPFWWITLFEPP